MTRRERLMAVLTGRPVDRPPVCFYELNGLDQNPADTSPFNIFSDPSWKPLLDLTREKTDLIPRRYVPWETVRPDPVEELTTRESWEDENGSGHWRAAIRAGKRTLTAHHRRDRDIHTTWTLEHPVKDEDDLLAWLDLPEGDATGEPKRSVVEEADAKVGDAGIVMLEASDPLGVVAPLFHMETFTVIALTRPDLMHRALEKASRRVLPRLEGAARAFPGRLWRICGSEYASPPYLPPRLFREYVTRYTIPMVEILHRHGSYARIHCHGRLTHILDHIAETGCDALDPIEPPPQGDVALSLVRRKYGKNWTLFGNLEVSDIETLPTPAFERKIETALREGTEGEGRGFVLMPGSCPYGRKISDLTLRNYEKMVEHVERWNRQS